MNQVRYWITIVLSFFLFSLVPWGAWAETPENTALAAVNETLQTHLNYVWILASAALVFLMQAGFMCLEAGMSPAKHSINVAIKNMADFILAIVAFWAVGFGIMFGASQGGWIGTSDYFISVDDPWTVVFFIFQSVFVGTAATIDSGAIAGRTRFGAYLLLSLVISTMIYPVFGHWAWGSLLHSDQQGWLEALGFLDFAGSTVVHSVGGWVALAGVIIIGPRLHKFDKDGKPQRMAPHNMTLSYLGTFILFFGWFGFNGGSTLSATPEVAPIILNTILAAALGGVSCSGLSWMYSPFKRPEGEMISNGVLGGLVAITAGCSSVDTVGAAIIGFIAGIVVFVGINLIEKVFKLDDVVGAIAVHGFAGAWGTLAVGIFIQEHLLERSRLEQIGIQALGVVVAFLWSFLISLLLMKIIDTIIPLRVSAEDEELGLNVSEHGASSTLLNVVKAMHHATMTGNMDNVSKIETEPGTHEGDLAKGFNQMIDVLGNRTQIIQQISSGNLSLDISLVSNEDSLGKALQVMLSELNNTLNGVAEVSGKVSNEAQNVANVSTNLSDGVTRQAQAVEQITSTIDRLSEQTQNNAEHAGRANQLSSDVSSTAQSGDTQVKAMLQAMQEIQSAAVSISNMVKLIDDVAFQTQLLALNASVEAARAGEHGKGFAVVANEVRNLAGNSAEAAKEIATQIQDTVEKVKSGMGITEQAAQSFQEIASGIAHVTDLVSQIDEASKQQVTAIHEVHEGVHQINEVTQHQMQVASETATESGNLASNANTLKRLIQRFRLRRAQQTVPAIV